MTDHSDDDLAEEVWNDYLADLKEGLAQSAAGETVDLGSFEPVRGR